MHDPNTPREPETMSSADVLGYMAGLGRDLTTYAVKAQAMLAAAEEKGIPVDISRVLAPFHPLQEYEKQLVHIRAELLLVQSAMLAQGVVMTQEDMRARLEKMGVTLLRLQQFRSHF